MRDNFAPVCDQMHVRLFVVTFVNTFCKSVVEDELNAPAKENFARR